MTRKISASRLHAALDEILGDDTEAVILIATTGDVVTARSFGDIEEAVWATNETVISLEMNLAEPMDEIYAH